MPRIAVDRIRVEDRHRQDLGDLSDLMESIERLGLLHPVVITDDFQLIAGQRRLEACRKLGWDDVPATVIGDMDSAVDLLVAERDENTCRKDMDASELYALGKALEELERPKARSRQAHGETAPGKNASDQPIGSVETRDVVGDGIGVSGPQWQRLKYLGDQAADGNPHAAAILDGIDAGEESVWGGYQKLRERDKTGESTDNGNVGSIRSIPKRRSAVKQLRNLVKKVDSLAYAAERIDVDGVKKGEAAAIIDGLSDGLSSLSALRNRLRKAAK